ncbi:hypothetical protein SO694_00165016 [Aureococcus anophagefferens]|uniref:Uncharacterized protein n=1 Tax=Aureococcus anophagefferens TaxID=44056 RepID=A0ABR1G6K5_AURAN
MNARERRLAARAAEREKAKAARPATKPDAVGDTPEDREAQKHAYTAALERDRAARERARADEAAQQKQAEADFASKFAAPSGALGGDAKIAARKEHLKRQKDAYEQRRQQLVQRVASPPPPTPPAAPRPVDPLRDAPPPRGGGGLLDAPRNAPAPRPIDPLRDARAASGGGGLLDAPPPERPRDPSPIFGGDAGGRAPAADPKAAYAARSFERRSRTTRGDDGGPRTGRGTHGRPVQGAGEPANRDPSPIFGEPSRRDAFGNERAAVDKQSYAAQLREQMAQDAGRRDAERARARRVARALPGGGGLNIGQHPPPRQPRFDHGAPPVAPAAAAPQPGEAAPPQTTKTPPGYKVGPTGAARPRGPAGHAGPPVRRGGHAAPRVAAARGPRAPPGDRPEPEADAPLFGHDGRGRRDEEKRKGNLWKHQLEVDMREREAQKKIKDREEKARADAEEARLARERAEIDAAYAKEQEKQRQQQQREEDQRQVARDLEERRLKREREAEDQRRRDAEDDARVARAAARAPGASRKVVVIEEPDFKQTAMSEPPPPLSRAPSLESVATERESPKERELKQADAKKREKRRTPRDDDRGGESILAPRRRAVLERRDGPDDGGDASTDSRLLPDGRTVETRGYGAPPPAAPLEAAPEDAPLRSGRTSARSGKSSARSRRASASDAGDAAPEPEDDFNLLSILRRNAKRLERLDALAGAADAAAAAAPEDLDDALHRLVDVANEPPPARSPRPDFEASLPNDVRWAVLAPEPALPEPAKKRRPRAEPSA